ncbi:TPA: hypothetical protein EYN98_24980 [Candidatus Poribacteria bacterium]|nr:hypothetical protein [Candidatus Poribacteria bacterium]
MNPLAVNPRLDQYLFRWLDDLRGTLNREKWCLFGTRIAIRRPRMLLIDIVHSAVLCLILPERKLCSIRKYDRGTVCIRAGIHIDLSITSSLGLANRQRKYTS